jgi:hypothetical protein
MKSFALASCFAIIAPLLAPGCSASPQSVGQLPDGGNPGDDGGSGSCSGSAPLCFGSNAQMCCGNDPAGTAVCHGGQWTCGGAPAPGCNGTSCLAHDAGPPLDGSSGTDGSSGGCVGTAPLCFGSDVQMCCGNDPAGSAVCQGGQWTCGGAPAPGCNGTSCLAQDAGPPLDGSSGTDGSMVSDASIDGSGPDCACPASTICVGTRAIGGAQFTPDDAGACPQGMHPEMQQGSLVCERDFSYECMAPPGQCGANIDCACAGSTYCPASQTCVDPSTLPQDANLSPSAVLVCELAVP